jgi:hypothetical protein
LERGYHVHAKDYSGRHARCLVQSVGEWFDDPHVAERQVSWVTEAPSAYVRVLSNLIGIAEVYEENILKSEASSHFLSQKSCLVWVN